MTWAASWGKASSWGGRSRARLLKPFWPQPTARTAARPAHGQGFGRGSGRLGRPPSGRPRLGDRPPPPPGRSEGDPHFGREVGKTHVHPALVLRFRKRSAMMPAESTTPLLPNGRAG